MEANGPLFKLHAPQVIAKHYTLLSILISINIVAWIILLFVLDSGLDLFAILLLFMIVIMVMELVAIFYLVYGLKNSFSPSYKSVASVFIITSLSISSIIIPCSWSSWLLGNLRYIIIIIITFNNKTLF